MVVGQTLVLLMTDVEGSTRRWREAPDAMNAAMDRHHQILHDAVEEFGGWRPVDQGEGDSIFAAFSSAPAAAKAASAMQLALQSEPWPEGAQLSVRMALHVGDVIHRGGNLYGDTVNRCARIRSVAAGGQVLLSSGVYELIRDRLDLPATLKVLGEHRLKDLIRPERLYQLSIHGLPHDFPPLRSLERAEHNLPIQPSTFVGREREVQAVADLLRRTRLVTITGFGGMGKTRLALQAAAEVTDGDGDGVWFVDLSSITDPDRVPSEIAAVLEVPETGHGAAAAVLTHLRDKRLLLILDNLEQVLGCAPFIADVHSGCPGVVVLVTSREPLRLRSEHEFALSPLSVPSPDEIWEDHVERLGTYEAVQLFVDRAVAASRTFSITNESAPAVAAIVARLDGHPLAIELAAARLKILSPQTLLTRLGSTLTVLTGGGRDHPERHQTLHATITWSYQLLPEAEQVLLDRLSVFAGACSLDAIEVICGPGVTESEPPLSVLDGVAALVDKSLLRADDGLGERGFSLLQSIHDFAAEQLAQRGGAHVLRARHASYFCALGQVASIWDTASEDRAVAAITPYIAELRAAYDHLAAGAESLADFPWTCLEYLTRSGSLSEAMDKSRALLEVIPVGRPDRASVQHQLAWSLVAAQQRERGLAIFQAIVDEAEQQGDWPRLTFGLASLVRYSRGDSATLQLCAKLQSALANRPPDARDYLDPLLHAYKALAASLRHVEPSVAVSAAQEAVRMSQQGGPHAAMLAAATLASTLLAAGDVGGARTVMEQVDLATLGRTRQPVTAAESAAIFLAAGDVERARQEAQRARVLADALGTSCPLADQVLADLDLLAQNPAAALNRCLTALDQMPGDRGVQSAALLWRAARANRLMGDGHARDYLDAAQDIVAVEVLDLPTVLAAHLEDALLRGDAEAERVAREDLRRQLTPGSIPVAFGLR